MFEGTTSYSERAKYISKDASTIIVPKLWKINFPDVYSAYFCPSKTSDSTSPLLDKEMNDRTQ
jgi:hypothetical protein